MNATRVFHVVAGLILALVTATSAPAQEVENTSYTAPDGSRVLQHRVVVPASLAEVWHAFTTAEGVRSWAVPFAHVDFRLGRRRPRHGLGHRLPRRPRLRRTVPLLRRGQRLVAAAAVSPFLGRADRLVRGSAPVERASCALPGIAVSVLLGDVTAAILLFGTLSSTVTGATDGRSVAGPRGARH
jgi:hypothetical protein